MNQDEPVGTRRRMVAVLVAVGALSCGAPSGQPRSVRQETTPSPRREAGALAPALASSSTAEDAKDAQVAASAASSTSPPSVARDFDEPFGPNDYSHELGPKEPDAVREEQEHLEREYAQLAETQEPRFRERSFVLSVVKPYFDVPEGQQQYVEVHAAPLGDAGAATLLWINHGGLQHLIAVVDDAGAVQGRVHVEGRARVTLRDVVGDSVPEVFVDRILGTSLSTYPSEWSIYRVSRANRLLPLLTQAKSHSTGSKYQDWALMNHFEFSGNGELIVRTVYSNCAGFELVPRCPALGTAVALRYDQSTGRYRLRAGTPAAPR